MAEDLVLSAISSLTSLYNDEVNLFQSVNTERKKLESNLSTIKAVLQDAEKKQLSNTSDPLNDWLQKLKDALYELDEILDDCSIEHIRDEYEGDRSCAFLGFLHPQKVMFRHNISGKMKAIRERLDFIAQEKDQFNFLPVERQANHSNIPQWRKTTSYITEDEILGREQDKEILVHNLLEGASHGDTFNVYPIVGLGGLGKTALAQLVYGDVRVTKHFDMKKWICVSENFDLMTLLKAITKSNGSPDELDDLAEKLQGMLQGTRYLIVLDDVWNDNPDKWMQLRSLLAYGEQGSAVLITTRLVKVAMMMRTPSAQPYHLTALSEDDCWQVFRKRAFGSCIFQKAQNLVRIGKDIARKCKGVPLAAKTLGGLLMFEADERFWVKIRDSELWNLPEEEGSIFAALRLSYHNLSPRTQRCFSFCSIFPKDHKIYKMNLIHLWMANGLISEEQSNTLELEDIGEMVVSELYWRSLIQDIKRDENSGSIIYFKMHDLVHDLAQSISSHESDSMERPSSTGLSPGTRHISIDYHGSESYNICNLLEKFEALRSLVFLSCNDPVSLAISHSLKHTKLRALDCSGLSPKVQVLPCSIGVLKHLRYLNLSYSDVRELPHSIGSLWNLQTLNLNHCSYLETFPASIGCLKNLRHLYNESCCRLYSMPQSIGGLTSLRTLTFVMMGELEKKEFQLSGLEHLKSLKGKLQIEHLDRVRDVKDAEKANLKEKEDLHDLYLGWNDVNGGSAGRDNAQKQIHILEALRPSPSLRRLELFAYQGMCFPQWMMDEMANFTCIQSLQLSLCINCRKLPPLWKLLSLKKLGLSCLHSMRYLIRIHEDFCVEDFVSLPTLESLSISNLSRLVKIVAGEKADMENNNLVIFPCLSKISIWDCPKLKTFNSGPLPFLRSLEFYNSERIMLSMLPYASYNLQSLSSLEKLTIYRCYSLESFPDQMFQGLTSLRKLSIGSCDKLKSFPESIKSLPSLEKLTIDCCMKLVDLSSVLKQLTSLANLSLKRWVFQSLDQDKLTALPSLKRFKMKNCEYLLALPNWMTHLVSLEELRIEGCSRLRTISDSIQQLSKLEKLYIRCCPELQKRCEKEKGQDWHKIAHIPHITIKDRWSFLCSCWLGLNFHFGTHSEFHLCRSTI